jgi:hypothetical protein
VTIFVTADTERHQIRAQNLLFLALEPLQTALGPIEEKSLLFYPRGSNLAEDKH